eukprot:3450434-Amphidinium_carterae.1
MSHPLLQHSKGGTGLANNQLTQPGGQCTLSQPQADTIWSHREAMLLLHQSHSLSPGSPGSML